MVRRDDPGALAVGVGRVIDGGSVARRLGAAACERIEQRYSVEAIGHDLAVPLLLAGKRP